MKRALAILIIAVAAFASGAASVFYFNRPSVPQRWITVVPDASPTLFDITAMESDIPPPEPGKLEGRVKFLQCANGIQIGYVLKLPEKYRQETKEKGFTIRPPDQVSYTGEFTFNLQDGDGFSLAKITGPDESLAAASDNQIQGATEATVPESVAAHTKKIAVSSDAKKCNVCDQ